jgi:uncharacterized membrane protein
VDLNFSFIGWIHTFASVAAMLAFVPVMLARKGSPRHRAWGRTYAIAYLVLCVTAFGVYSQQRFLTAMLLSAYNLFGGAVNEAFLRIGALRAMAGAEASNSPLVGMTHAVVMFVFLFLIGGYVTASIVSRPGANRATIS